MEFLKKQTVLTLEIAAIFWYIWTFFFFFMPHWIISFLMAIGNSHIALNILYLSLGCIPIEFILIGIVGKYRSEILIPKWDRIGLPVLVFDVIYGGWIYYGFDPFNIAQSILLLVFMGMNVIFIPILLHVCFFKLRMNSNPEISPKSANTTNIIIVIGIGLVGIMILLDQYWGNALAIMSLLLILLILEDVCFPELRISGYFSSLRALDSLSTPYSPGNLNQCQSQNLRKYTFPFIIFTSLLCLDFWWQEFFIDRILHLWLNLVLGGTTIAYLLFARNRYIPAPTISHISLALLLITFLLKATLIEVFMPLWLMFLLNIVAGWIFGAWISAIWQLWTQEFKGPHHGFFIICYLMFSMLFCGIFAISVNMYYERELDLVMYSIIIIGLWFISAMGFLIGNFKKNSRHAHTKEASP